VYTDALSALWTPSLEEELNLADNLARELRAARIKSFGGAVDELNGEALGGGAVF